jgi:nucleoside-diphosphate-sugar epimerase
MKDTNIRTILITGGGGYIGSFAVEQFITAGYKVKIFDKFIFGEDPVKTYISSPAVELVKGDIRDTQFVMSQLKEVDAVLHLAAIVGAPESSRIPELTWDINYHATKNLIDEVIKANQLGQINVKRFIFVSTCSNYGSSGSNTYVNEQSSLDPISPYAESKVTAEKYLTSIDTKSLNWTICRLATVYGVSPRMRFDLLVNEFTREAVLKKKLIIYGNQGRAFVHIADVINSFKLFLESPIELVTAKIFNVGDTQESNKTKSELGQLVASVIKGTEVSVIEKDLDDRDYKVNFDLIRKSLGFKTTKTIKEGIREIEEYITSHLNNIDPYDNKYTNLKAYLSLNDSSTNR